MKIKLKTISGNVPEYETEGSAGMDLKAHLDEPVTIKPMDRYLVPTGLFIELPQGYEAQVRARSGLSIKNGITLVNAVGTIDSDYRGEIKVPVINLGKEEFTIEPGARMAQMIIAKYEKITWEIAEKVDETNRGSGGFGHTGV